MSTLSVLLGDHRRLKPVPMTERPGRSWRSSSQSTSWQTVAVRFSTCIDFSWLALVDLLMRQEFRRGRTPWVSVVCAFTPETR